MSKAAKYFTNIIKFIISLFNDHPESIGETYLEHMRNSLLISLLSLALFFVLLVHSIFPFIFKKTGSNLVLYMDNKCKRSFVFSKNSDF